jgi:hypothetical protein
LCAVELFATPEVVGGGRCRVLNGTEALHGAVVAVKEQLGGAVISRECPDVCDGGLHGGVGVVFLLAMAAGPAAVVEFDDPEEPCHAVSVAAGPSFA